MIGTVVTFFPCVCSIKNHETLTFSLSQCCFIWPRPTDFVMLVGHCCSSKLRIYFYITTNETSQTCSLGIFISLRFFMHKVWILVSLMIWMFKQPLVGESYADLRHQKYKQNCWTKTKVFQNWNQEWKQKPYDLGSIGFFFKFSVRIVVRYCLV